VSLCDSRQNNIRSLINPARAFNLNPSMRREISAHFLARFWLPYGRGLPYSARLTQKIYEFTQIVRFDFGPSRRAGVRLRFRLGRPAAVGSLLE
jgi:hypothetical protein